MIDNESENSLRAAAQAIIQSRIEAEPQEEQAEKPSGETEQESEQSSQELATSDNKESQETEEKPDNQESESAQEEQGDFIEFKANGETHRMAVDKVKELASMGLDYTRKTQELSARVKTEAEKQFKEYTSGMEAERKRLLDNAKMLESLYDRPLVTAEKLEQLMNDGEYDEYHRLKFQEDKRKELLSLAKGEITRLEEERTQKEKKEFADFAAREAEILFQKMPEFNNQESFGRYVKYLQSAGYTNQDIATLADHRAIMMVEKARRYDELQKNKNVQPLKKDAPKIIRRNGSVEKASSGDKDLHTSLESLKKTGSIRDAGAAINKILKNRG